MIEIINKIKKNSLSVVLFGAGDLGELAEYALKKRDIKIDYFCDSHKKKQGKLFCGIKTISPEELSKLSKNIVIFVCNTQYVGSVTSLLKEMKFNLVYDLMEILKNTDFTGFSAEMSPDQGKFTKLGIERQIALHEHNCLKMKKEKFVVSNVDIVITERCSLKCRACSNLMQYYHRPQNSNHDLLFKSVDKLMKSIDKLYEFRIIGGDPFMNKKMYEVVNKLVTYKNVDLVTVYTNATILPKNENFECLKNKKVRLQLTNYGELSRKHDELIKMLDHYKIDYVSERVKKWQDIGKIKYEEKTEKELEKLFSNCCAHNLLTFLHGRLYRCPTAAHGVNLGAIPHNQTDIVDLADDNMNIEETRNKLKNFYYNKKFLTACSYCKGRDFGFGEIDAAIQTKKPLSILDIN